MLKSIILASAIALLVPTCASAQVSIGSGYGPPLAAYAGPGAHLQEVYECHYSPLFGKTCSLVRVRSVPAGAPDRAEYGTARPAYQVGQLRFHNGHVSASGGGYTPTYSQGFGHADFQNFNYGPRW